MNVALRCVHGRRTASHLTSLIRYYSVTGNPRADNALNTISGGRIESWMTKYENLVGLREVKEAQNKVIEAENAFQEVQAKRRQCQTEMTSIHSKLKEIHAQLDKVQRGEERYLSLLTEEYEILKDEKKLIVDLGSYEQLERDNFAALSSAVRESHERERARAERTKYWSIIGSVVGAAIGIIGTSVNNYLRMRELKGLVKQSTAEGFELKDVVGRLSESMKTQYNQIHALITDLRLFVRPLGNNSDGRVLTVLPSEHSSSFPHPTGSADREAETKKLMEFIRKQDETLESEIREVKKLLVVGYAVDQEKPVVYIGPEIENLLTQTEANIEWKMKINAIMTTAVVYGAFAASLAFLYNVLKGGSA